MTPREAPQRGFLQSLDELDADEVRAIRENLAWFQRFGPVERLRIAARQAHFMKRLRVAYEKSRNRNTKDDEDVSPACRSFTVSPHSG